MSTWILIVWFSFAGVPATIEGYTSYEACESAADKFIEQAKNRGARWACVTRR